MQPKINRHFLWSAPDNCPVIKQGKDGYDLGTCAEYLEDGICPSHGEVKPLIEAPISPDQAAQLVWLVRRDWEGNITASASIQELEANSLIQDGLVITPKGSIPLLKFKTNIGTIIEGKKIVFNRTYHNGGHSVTIW